MDANPKRGAGRRRERVGSFGGARLLKSARGKGRDWSREIRRAPRARTSTICASPESEPWPLLIDLCTRSVPESKRGPCFFKRSTASVMAPWSSARRNERKTAPCPRRYLSRTGGQPLYRQSVHSGPDDGRPQFHLTPPGTSRRERVSVVPGRFVEAALIVSKSERGRRPSRITPLDALLRSPYPSALPLSSLAPLRLFRTSAR